MRVQLIQWVQVQLKHNVYILIKMGSQSLPLLQFLVEQDDTGCGLALLLAVVSILACVMLAWWYRWQQPWVELPSPAGLPIVGNLPLLMLLTRKLPMHQVLRQLSERYGALMGLRLGSVPILVASTPEAARLVLQAHDRELSGRAPTMAASLFNGSPGLGACDILFSQPGPYWKLMRQLCTTHLFSSERILSFG
jgi:26-hydroxylase